MSFHFSHLPVCPWWDVSTLDVELFHHLLELLRYELRGWVCDHLIGGNQRAKFQAANLIEPEQLSLKRRRLHEKTDESIQAPKAVCQRLIQEITEVAPRVGRKLIHEPKILQIAQDLFQDKKINCIMVCKRTDRKVAPPKELMAIEAPYRRVIAIQREDGKVLIEDEWEHWEHLPQCKLVSKFVPCYMNITVYAANHPDFPQPQPVIQPPEADQSQVSERPCMTHPPCEDAQSGNQSEVTPNRMESDEPLSTQLDVHSSSQGERFRALSAETRQILIRMRKNLGHPSPQVFAQVLRQQGYSGDVIKGVEDMKCSICQKHQHPKIQRPATLKHEMDFEDKISMDGLTWTNRGGKTFHVYHFLDHGTNYHTAVAAPNRSADRAMERLTNTWHHWWKPFGGSRTIDNFPKSRATCRANFRGYPSEYVVLEIVWPWNWIFPSSAWCSWSCRQFRPWKVLYIVIDVVLTHSPCWIGLWFTGSVKPPTLQRSNLVSYVCSYNSRNNGVENISEHFGCSQCMWWPWFLIKMVPEQYNSKS